MQIQVSFWGHLVCFYCLWHPGVLCAACDATEAIQEQIASYPGKLLNVCSYDKVCLTFDITLTERSTLRNRILSGYKIGG